MRFKEARGLARRAVSALRGDYDQGQVSFSQEGEDILLSRLLRRDGPGFYVDVGAHHPRRFSNTYYFYRRGWRGINIDAMPGSMAEFRKIRPGDINIEQAIGSADKTVDYYAFSDGALNTMSPDLARQYERAGYRLVSTRALACRSLQSLLDANLPPGQKVDFMSLDVEGMEVPVLETVDWSRFRPLLVLVESLELATIWDLQERAECRLMESAGYAPVAKTLNTVFYQRKS